MQHYPLNKISQSNLDRLAASVLESYSYQDLYQFSYQKALKNEARDLWALTEDEDPESLQVVRERRGLGPEIQDEQLLARVFEIENNGLLLANVCRNDADDTLIEIFTTEDCDRVFVERWAKFLSNFFSWAKAKYIVCWPLVGSEAAKSLLSISGSYLADSFLAAHILDVPLAMNHDLSFRAFGVEQDWEWYEREYQQFLQENPRFSDIVPMTEKDDIAEACEERLCDVAMFKGERLGMVMAEVSTELGYQGILISDIFIVEKYRGKGFASSLQRGFLASRAEGCQLICGYIDASNKASLHNAMNQNRQILRQECYIPIASCFS
ncbi:GNAT family N-acetyltransferase [uncultured Pseudoteredinibacter sp.]|uniref:GNAT family N-acetyltransferase n=1 Tax=uncultured Pseudoteredinibacter sp. TaxID=1641701 RepID=UPI00262E6AE2|nr:GNAT family N-acetyltransferase [uncultured Pseudoteredinibacter sp.]